jgi:hypothetical protein
LIRKMNWREARKRSLRSVHVTFEIAEVAASDLPFHLVTGFEIPQPQPQSTLTPTTQDSLELLGFILFPLIPLIRPH